MSSFLTSILTFWSLFSVSIQIFSTLLCVFSFYVPTVDPFLLLSPKCVLSYFLILFSFQLVSSQGSCSCRTKSTPDGGSEKFLRCSGGEIASIQQYNKCPEAVTVVFSEISDIYGWNRTRLQVSTPKARRLDAFLNFFNCPRFCSSILFETFRGIVRSTCGCNK